MTPAGTILAFGPGPWAHGVYAGSPRYHLATLATLGWRIVYMDPPLRFRWIPAATREDDRELHALRPAFVPPFAVRHARGGAVAEAWRSLTARSMARQARTWCRRHGIQPDIHWFGAPWHGAILRALGPESPAVYHVYDELPLSPALSPRQRGRLQRWEEELLRSCQVTLCSSLPQLERRRPIARRVELLQNAVLDTFLTPSEPPAAPSIREFPPPRIVYGGVADHRLDPEFFRALLRSMSGGTLIFAGKRDPSLDPAFAREMEQDPRVRFLGSVPYRVYPAVYREADCLVLAHRRNPFTDAMYPEKINEYLASGKPIVAVDLPEVARLAAEARHPGAIRCAANAEEFARLCREALHEQDPAPREARLALARQHTWSREGRRLDAILRGLLEGAPPSGAPPAEEKP